MRFRSFWLAISWSIVILVLSFMSGKSFPSSDWMDWFKLDKWIHAFLYFTLFLLLYVPIDTRRLSKHRQVVLACIGYCLFLGVFTEAVQAFILTDRSGDLPDLIANTMGVVFAIVLVRISRKKWPWKGVND